MKAVYEYRGDPMNPSSRPTVMSETAFFQLWERALKRGVLGRYDGIMDEEYRIATPEAGVGSRAGPTVPTTGNAFADGALGLLAGGLQLANEVRDSRGWGYDR